VTADRTCLQAAYDVVAERYAELYHDELEHKPLDRALLDRFVEAVRGQGLVCDLGCGPGQITRYLHARGVEVFGMDLSAAMIAIARRLSPGINFVQGDLAAIDAADGTWSGIVTFYSLIHLPRSELVPTLRGLRRVLRPGGLLLLAFHLGEQNLHLDEWLGYRIQVDVCFFRRAEIEGFLAQAGLEIEEVVERDPYPEVEYQSRRAYLFARRPAPLNRTVTRPWREDVT
jgi:SAM-dependent methyltransferase